ncbi:MAG: flagellar biosynthesis anti-sigma factor FlgM [Armatimonadetes bacterium]|nr:flagellar biosynthesis anti-sigma factor FlgM [Armatimonadota bacterium]
MSLDCGSVPPVGPKGPTGPQGPHGPTEADKTQPVKEPAVTEAAASAAEVQAAARAMQAAPDVRLDRIAELRARIERGEFKIDANRIAEAIMEGE